MKGIVYEIMLFYIMFNLAIWMLATASSTGIIALEFSGPASYTPPTAFDFTSNIRAIMGDPLAILGVAISSLGAIVAVLAGHYLLGFGFITVVALTFIAPVFTLVFGGGLASILGQFGVSTIITTPLGIIMMFVELVFIVEFVGQRDVG
jgi:hypothetical protein